MPSSIDKLNEHRSSTTTKRVNATKCDNDNNSSDSSPKCQASTASSSSSSPISPPSPPPSPSPFPSPSPYLSTPQILFFLLILISYITLPSTFSPPTITSHQVFYYGWITALSTGLGALPLLFVREMDSWWIGVSNSIASGMMIAASYSLGAEGFDSPVSPKITIDENSQLLFKTFANFSSLLANYHPKTLTITGIVLGLIFLVVTKHLLSSYPSPLMSFVTPSTCPKSTRKILLIIFVMTLHSFSEGVGIGVSFGGPKGDSLGKFISASLAVHNIPEGLAVAIVLAPNAKSSQISKTSPSSSSPPKMSILQIFLYCILTSLPQPLMSVPSFLFVEYFLPLLPLGLGFACGAMFFVALFELGVEAWEEVGGWVTCGVGVVSLCAMMVVQEGLHD